MKNLTYLEDLELKKQIIRNLLPKLDNIDFNIQGRLEDWEILEQIPYKLPSCKFVIIHRLGLFGETRKTLRAIGEMIGVTQEVIRQREAKGLRILRSRRLRWMYPLITNEKLFSALTGYANFEELWASGDYY